MKAIKKSVVHIVSFISVFFGLDAVVSERSTDKAKDTK
jgi:hypothetical protein